METPCEIRTFFYSTCTHTRVLISHSPHYPHHNSSTSTSCPFAGESTYIINSECPWCTAGEKGVLVPKYEECVKEERRREFEGVVRRQMVECEKRTEMPRGRVE
jgi:hypothetical protein